MNLNERVVRRYASRLDVGETRENGNLRIHRYRDHLVLWDLSNAGKRGAQVERVSINPSYNFRSSEADQLLGNISLMIEGHNSFAGAMSTIRDYLVDYPDDLKISTTFERGVDVTPAGFKELRIQTPHVLIEVGYKEFRVKDLDDKHNEPTCIPASKGGVKSIPVFYRWVRDNEASIRHMKYYDVLREMSRLGIRYHDYCAMD